MNYLLLSLRLGSIGPQTFRSLQYERLLQNITPAPWIAFNGQDSGSSSGPPPSESTPPRAARLARKESVAHSGGVNVLAVDEQTSNYLVSGGADAALRLWDLEGRPSNDACVHHPIGACTKSTPGSHTHALTSVSIYPFDPVPSTILTTSYDKTLKLFSIGPARVYPVHTFDLAQTPYTHSQSPVASSAALIAVGTADSDVKLLDLRTGLSTHTLPGHTSAIFSVRWSPRSEHVLTSGSADGRVLLFDVRRAHSAFACLDLDDAIGVLKPDDISRYEPRPALGWNFRAHNGPVTGVRWVDSGRRLITCGHDQRIRVWDAATGRNELVHFGPRIKNARMGELAPLPSPVNCHGVDQERVGAQSSGQMTTPAEAKSS